MTRLKDVSVINRSALPETTDPDHRFRYVDIGSVGPTGRLSELEEIRFGDAPSRARRLVRQGDSIVSTIRTYLRAIAHVETEASDLVVSTGFATLTPRDAVAPAYLTWAVLSSEFIESVVSRSVGVSYPAITATELGRIHVGVPPPDEQQRIADYLDAETSRVDELIAEQEEQRSLIAERRHAQISGLVGARVGGGSSELGGALNRVPSSWQLVPLRLVATIQSGLTLGKTYEGVLQERPYLRVANVQDGYIDNADISSLAVSGAAIARHELRAGDVLVNEGNGNPANLGRGAIWDGSIEGCLHQNHVFAIRPGRSVRSDWIEKVLASSAGRAYFLATSSQVGIASTNRSKVGRFPLPLPPIDNQDAILDEIEAATGDLDALSGELGNQIALLQEHRQALITHAVTQGIDGLQGVA